MGSYRKHTVFETLKLGFESQFLLLTDLIDFKITDISEALEYHLPKKDIVKII